MFTVPLPDDAGTMKKVMLCIGVFVWVSVSAAGKEIHVRNQMDFESLHLQFEEALASEDTLLSIQIDPGQYFFREVHLSLSGIDRPDLRISITGDGAVLTALSDSGDYHIDKGYVYLPTQEDVDIREPVRKARSWPVPVLFDRSLYRIRCDEPDRSENEVDGWQIILSQWFKGAVYPVEKIRNGWLYFRKDRDYGTGLWSELRFGRCLPRYILCHTPVRSDLHACSASNFMTVRDSRLGGLAIVGVSFLGNRSGDCLIRLDDISAEDIRISRCYFTGIKSDVISSEMTDHLRVEDCVFRRNYLSCIIIGEGGEDVQIVGNRFLDNGLMMTNAPVVFCQGKDYRITRNYFEDFSYAAIRVGIHYTMPDRFGTTGHVDRNEICMSESFRQGVPRALIDGGAIYVSTINTAVAIRENFIHDIRGPHGNRGIFGDDGVVNVEIAGNRISRIENGKCIDLRKCFRVGRERKSKISRPNVGNKIHDNVCDGGFHVYVRKDDPGSYVSNNVVQPR